MPQVICAVERERASSKRIDAISSGLCATMNIPILSGNQRWFLVHCKPKSEARARVHLGAQHFRTFLPTIQRTIRHARRFRSVSAPLFPRYLFVVLDLERDRWLSVQGTIGVSSLVCNGGRPTPVPEGIVEALLQSTISEEASLSSNLYLGQRVRLAQGPFADLIGVLHRLDGNGRASVLLDMMGSKVPITIHGRGLLPAA